MNELGLEDMNAIRCACSKTYGKFEMREKKREDLGKGEICMYVALVWKRVSVVDKQKMKCGYYVCVICNVKKYIEKEKKTKVIKFQGIVPSSPSAITSRTPSLVMMMMIYCTIRDKKKCDQVS